MGKEMPERVFSPSTCHDPFTWHFHFLDVETFTSCLGAFPLRLTPAPWQEELEFAIMRIEALKLARQIALASRSRQDAKVLVCCCRALPPESDVWSERFFANRGPGRHCWCSTEENFPKS